MIDARIKCATYFKSVGLKLQLFDTFVDVGLKRQARQRIDTSPKASHFNRLALEKSMNSAIKKREHVIKNKEESVKESGVITLFKEYQFIHEQDLRITVTMMRDFLKLCKEHFQHVTISGNRAELLSKIQSLMSEHENQVIKILKDAYEKSVQSCEASPSSQFTNAALQSAESVPPIEKVQEKTRKRIFECEQEDITETEQESQVSFSHKSRRRGGKSPTQPQ